MNAVAQQRRWSIHEPIAGMRVAIEEMTRAVDALLDSNPLLASQHLRAANRDDVRQHFGVVAGPVKDGRPKKRPATARESVSMPSTAIRRDLYERDRWHCRFCQAPVIDPEAAQRIRVLAPDEFISGRRNVEKHSVLLALRASPDHVLPRCHGGSNALDNLVTACGCCQFGRGDWLLEDVGIAVIRPTLDSNWDGLRRVLKLARSAASIQR